MTEPDKGAEAQTQELSPEALKVLGRARRSFGISIAVLLLGFMAIVGALVYRSWQGREVRLDGAYALGEITMPQGAEIVAIVPTEGMIAVTYRAGDTLMLRLIDGKTGAVLRDIASVRK